MTSRNRVLKHMISVVVPIYNEEQSIDLTISTLKRQLDEQSGLEFEIICVDDGSLDKSLEILKKHPGIRIVQHQINKGYGEALKSGIRCSKGDWILITDADQTYNIADLPMLLEYKNNFDMVVGARRGKGIASSPLKFLARAILKQFVKVLTGTRVPDLNSGFRIFKKTMFLQYQHLLPSGFSFTTTITVAALFEKAPIKYVDTEYFVRQGKSNIKPIRDFLGFLMLIIRLGTYFDPLRLFLPVSLFVAFIGILRGIRDVLTTQSIGSLAVLLTLFAFNIFFTGLLADVVVKNAKKSG